MSEQPAQLTEEEKRAQRREALGRILAHAQRHRARVSKQNLHDRWSPGELAACIPWAEKIKAKECSQYRACIELTKELKGRTFEAIRKKLKNYVNYGIFA